jgi:uncharacterized protein (DUF1800 family)
MTAGETTIAFNRFGLGARPGDAAPADPRAWLKAQLSAFDPKPPALAGLPARAELVGLFRDYREQLAEAKREAKAMGPAEDGAKPDDPLKDVPRELRQGLREAYTSASTVRMTAALQSDTPFGERLVHFWANHFAVSADKLPVVALAGNYEFEAIRPHVMRSFGDLLGAAVTHPAMLIYLDQAQSIGPNSPLAARVERLPRAAKRKIGLNENLAREIMELHTLGVRTGYSQADVTEFARALTGLTIAGFAQGRLAQLVPGAPGETVFAEALHEPGARTVMGKRYAQEGAKQAEAVLADLAAHPATARHVATQLARHFIADDPPPAAVARIEAAFNASHGDLPTVYRALVDSPEAWTAQPGKFRNPWDWTVAALRASGVRQLPGKLATAGLMQQLGQPVWRPGSPAGWGDTAADWAGPGALLTRVEVAQQIASRVGDAVDARALVGAVLPDASAETRQAIARSEAPALGLALLLASPEFLRR